MYVAKYIDKKVCPIYCSLMQYRVKTDAVQSYLKPLGTYFYTMDLKDANADPKYAQQIEMENVLIIVLNEYLVFVIIDNR